MATPESGFWSWLRAKLIEKDIFHQRIETVTGTGVPDLFLCVPGGLYARNGALNGQYYGPRPVWCELKALHSAKVKIRPAQHVWHKKADMHGVQVLVLNRDPAVHSITVWSYPYEVTMPDADNRDQSPVITSQPVWQGTQKAFAADMKRILQRACAHPSTRHEI